MKALKIIGIILGVIIVLVVLGVGGFMLSLSGEHYMERSRVINAPQEQIFKVVNDFSYAKDWSPWFQIDPNTQYVYSDNTAGKGAYYTWESEHEQVGTGRQDIIESTPYSYVNTKMVFGDMKGDYHAAFKLEPIEGGVNVTWTLDSKAANGGFMEKFFVDYLSEKVIGPVYEEGLQNLETLVLNLPNPEPEAMAADSVGAM